MENERFKEEIAFFSKERRWSRANAIFYGIMAIVSGLAFIVGCIFMGKLVDTPSLFTLIIVFTLQAGNAYRSYKIERALRRVFGELANTI